MGSERGFTLSPATVEDCRELAPLVREEDLREALRSGYPDALSALNGSLSRSTRAWAARDGEGKILFVAGYFSPGGGLALVWLLASGEVEAKRRAFILACREILNILRKFEVLGNLVDADNTRSQRFLRHLGFTVGSEPTTIGEHGFLPFYREA